MPPLVGLDFNHRADNLHKARRAVAGEEPAGATETPGQRGVADLLPTAKHEGYVALRDALVAWKGPWGGRKRQAAEQLLGYVTDRREMLCYPKFRERGRDIGSGPTESMGRATTERLKGVGRRWDADQGKRVGVGGAGP